MMRLVSVAVICLLFAGCVTLASPGDDASRTVVREFHIEALEKTIEVFPNKWATMWTFNGDVPGPLIRATEGDIVRIHFYNNHSLPHTLHFHGSHPFEMDGDDHQAVPPGGTFTYEFVAGPPGAYVYHCHIDTPVHIPRGLYGQFIVDPREGWPGVPPDAELFAIFGDWNPRGNATAETYLLNGRAYPFTQPFQVRQGDAVRMFVASMSSYPVAAHLHGYLPRQVWPIDQPIDVVALAHAETRVLTFEATAPGAWMFHDHYEQHLMNDGIYPGGALTTIEVGHEYWGRTQHATHDSAQHRPQKAAPPSLLEQPTNEHDQSVTQIRMADMKFVPANLTIKVGSIVEWHNEDGTVHTITSTSQKGPLDSPYVKAGETFRHTFETPGTYEYRCLPHSARSQDGTWTGMVGQIEVVE